MYGHLTSSVFESLRWIPIAKNRRISHIVIISLIIITSNLLCVLAYNESINFNDNNSSILTNCGRILWYQDYSSGHGSAPALRSGPIRNSGMSCIGKYVEGPANLQFYWKLDQYARIGELSFNVDNYSVILCTSSDWAPVSYAIAPGMHWISWEYKKQYSYPEFVGAGWIDDLQIVSDKPGSEKKTDGFTFNNSMKALKQDINRLDSKLLAIERNVSGLHESISTTIDGVNKHVYEIDNISAIIVNRSQSQVGSGDLSWLHDRVVFVSDKTSNLTDILIKNKNKIIILDDGVYYTNGLCVSSNGAYLKSLKKWGAKIDAGNNSKGIVIDTANNITLDSLVISNCTDGIHIENSSHCNIINNLVEDFNRIGIIVKNSSHNTFMHNSLIPRDITRVVGIQMRNSFNNTFALNKIEIGLNDNDSYLLESDFSKENMILISDNGRIWEKNNLLNNSIDEFYCEIWDSTFNCWLCNTRETINLSRSENIWIHPSID